MICVALFPARSFLCGIAPSLSMLADTCPGKDFGMAFAVYGVAGETRASSRRWDGSMGPPTIGLMRGG